MENLICVRNLKKSYKEKKVLGGVSFDVRRGEVLCILGPNGAGKTTTINILIAALQSDGGEITFNGEKINRQLRAYKRSLGIVPQEIALFDKLAECGDMGVVFVRGGAGMGKTTLLSSFLREAKLPNVGWLSLDPSVANIY